MIHTILSILFLIPKLVDAAEKIATCLKEAVDDYHSKKKLAEFDEKIKESKQTKDTSGLEAMFDDRKKKK